MTECPFIPHPFLVVAYVTMRLLSVRAPVVSSFVAIANW
jgi:hypothetical protein